MRVFNLVKPWPYMSRKDLVLMRNVLIYFDAETRERILKSIRGVLKDDGWFMVGSTECARDVDGLQPRLVGDTRCYQAA